MVDALVDFLMAVPGTDGQDTLTSAMNWKYNLRLALLCLTHGFPLTSDFGKYAYKQLADSSAHVHVQWLAVYESSFDVRVPSQCNAVPVVEVLAKHVFENKASLDAEARDFAARRSASVALYLEEP